MEHRNSIRIQLTVKPNIPALTILASRRDCGNVAVIIYVQESRSASRRGANKRGSRAAVQDGYHGDSNRREGDSQFHFDRVLTPFSRARTFCKFLPPPPPNTNWCLTQMHMYYQNKNIRPLSQSCQLNHLFVQTYKGMFSLTFRLRCLQEKNFRHPMNKILVGAEQKKKK
jgi:hypothetical protein